MLTAWFRTIIDVIHRLWIPLQAYRPLLGAGQGSAVMVVRGHLTRPGEGAVDRPGHSKYHSLPLRDASRMPAEEASLPCRRRNDHDQTAQEFGK